MNRLIIIGAGGHGKVIAGIAESLGYKNICFVDDSVAGNCMGYRIVGKTEELPSLNNGNTDFIIAIGNNYVRESVAKKYDVNWTTLIHPSAIVAKNAVIGLGTVVTANAVINVCSKIGKHCIINTGAIIEHDSLIGDYAHISPGVAFGGTVHIGSKTHIGLGAMVRNNIDICDDCIVGAGAVVVKNIEERGTYVGVPARKIK